MIRFSSGRWCRNQRRSMLAAAGLTFVGWLGSGLWGGTTHASVDTTVAVALDAGDIVVVEAVDRSKELVEGDTNTVFSLRLPDGSVCAGDSANDDWRVQSFIVPAATDLQSLHYGATRPRGEFMYGLYTTEGGPYVQVLTAQNEVPGQPGQILEPPALSFAVFTPDLLPVGRYRIGISCSFFEAGAKFWDAEIVLTEAPDVQPGERRWSVASVPDAPAGDSSTTSDSGGSNSTPIIIIAFAALAALVVAATFLRRIRRAPTLSKEHS